MFPRAGAPETVAWLDDANKTVFTLAVELTSDPMLKVKATRAGEGESASTPAAYVVDAARFCTLTRNLRKSRHFPGTRKAEKN